MTVQSNLQNTFERIRRLFEDSRKIVVLAHIDPDGDSIGTQLAFATYLRDLGKEVILARESTIPDKYKFLSGVEEISHIDSIPKNTTVDTALVLECSRLSRIGEASVKRYLGNGVKVVNIDHHEGNDLQGDANWVDAKLSSVGEMAYEYFDGVGYNLSPQSAEQLYTAILTDTGRFHYLSTSPRTMEIAGLLIAAGANSQSICDNVYHDMQHSSMKLMGRVLNNIEYLHDGRTCLLTLSLQMLSDTGAHTSESEGLVKYALYSSGVQVGVFLKEIDDNITKVSLRSRDKVNVAAIAETLDGGGHFNAAGCTIKLPLAAARDKIIQILGKVVYGE